MQYKHVLVFRSMKLLDYLKSLDLPARQGFASRCDTSVDYLFQLGRGDRKTKIQLAVTIERESGGMVTCEDMLPDVDWAYLRNTARIRGAQAA